MSSNFFSKHSSLSSIMMIRDVSPLTKYILSENISEMIKEWQPVGELTSPMEYFLITQIAKSSFFFFFLFRLLNKRKNFYPLRHAKHQWEILHICHAFIHVYILFFNNWLSFSNLTHHSFINIKRESVRKSNYVKFKHTQSEIDYIIKHVSGILQNIFSMDRILSTDW